MRTGRLQKIQPDVPQINTFDDFRNEHNIVH